MKSKSENERRERQDWLIVLLILLLGFMCVIIAGQWALRFSPSWKLNADMDSGLDPNSNFLTKPVGFFEPVDSAILTQPAWVKVFLTPGARFVTRTPPPAGPAKNSPTEESTVVGVTNTLPATTLTNTVIPTNTLIWYPPPAASRTPKPRKTKGSPPNTAVPPSNTPLPTIDLEITMSDSGSYTPGAGHDYTIVVTNNSARRVTGATVSDLFGPQITGASWTCIPDPGATCNPGSGSSFTDTINLRAGRSVTYTVTANVSGFAVGPLPNTATVVTLPFETDPGDNTASLTTAGPGGGAGGEINIGPGDGSWITLGPPSPASVTMVISPAISNSFVFYERRVNAPPPPHIELDMIQIEVSTDGSSWQSVFYWGDGTSDTNTNVALPVGGACPTETDNCPIPIGSLYNSTGITIDVGPGSYPWIRITCPGGDSGDGCDIDSIEP